MFIILTDTQRAHVEGPTGPSAALQPIALANGTEWVLPVAVLSDPNHAEHHAYLDALPQRAVDANEFPQPDPIEGV